MTGDAPESTAGDLRDVLGMGATQAVARLAPGQLIDAYRIDEEIGAGGMGRVYRARDQRLGRDVALKLHARSLSGDLLREASALARLAHPNVVTVYEVGTWANHPWVAMELVRGGTARAWQQGRTTDEILALYRAAGTGLAAAHAAGMVHRDFKPDNVLVGEDGRARVADFGLAMEQHGATAPDIGTPGYMAPEQRRGGSVDARADQYAFAVSLWEALAGGHPFASDSTNRGTSSGRALPPIPKVPRRVTAALLRALEVDPAKRWPAMEDLLAAISPPRSRAWLLAGGGVALGIGAVVIALTTRSEPVATIDCEVGAKAIEADWSPAVRRAVLAGSPSRDQAERLISTVDAWVSRWSAGSRDACAAHATQTQSPAIYDHRLACLERSRISLRASISMFDLAPGKALDVANALPHLEDCADVAMLVGGATPPRDVVGAALAANAESQIANARALRMAGDAKRALAIGRAAVAYADRNKLASASARARIELAAAIHASGTLDGVRATFEEAVKFASEAHDDVLVARAWLNLIDAIAIRHAKPEDADQLLLVAEAAISRAGNPPALTGFLAGTRGDLALAREQFADAVPLLEQLIAASAALYGPDDVDQTRGRNRLAQALLQLGRYDEARAQLARAAEVIETHYGPTHPNLGVVMTTRGQVESKAGDYREAIAHYQRALAIKTAMVGPDHASLAPTLISLAYAQADQGAVAEARVSATRGAAIAERTLPGMHPNLGLALALRGKLEVATGAWAEAEVTLERAIDILDKAGGNTPIDQALSARSRLHLRAGRTTAARADADRAVTVAEQAFGSSLELAVALAVRAEVERAAGDRKAARASYARAIELATQRVGPDHIGVKRLEAAAAGLD